MEQSNQPQTRQKGFEFEALAVKYLEEKGLSLLCRNFSCKLGEIDIICVQKEIQNRVDQQIIVFVEVRFRKNSLFGGPLASVDFKKQQKLVKSAQFFLKTRPSLRMLPCRFDVVAITMKDTETEIEWVQNAF